MNYSYDAPFADVFLCDGDLQFHDYYYVSPSAPQEDSLYYQINRTGIETRTPNLFFVERSSAAKYCEIFCIFSGKGTLHFRGRTWQLGKRQLVVLPPGEAHSYSSDEKEPLGMSWGRVLRRRFLPESSATSQDTQGPVIEGAVFSDASAALSSAAAAADGRTKRADLFRWSCTVFCWKSWKMKTVCPHEGTLPGHTAEFHPRRGLYRRPPGHHYHQPAAGGRVRHQRFLFYRGSFVKIYHMTPSGNTSWPAELRKGPLSC